MSSYFQSSLTGLWSNSPLSRQ